jgi:hypothetical protein
MISAFDPLPFSLPLPPDIDDAFAIIDAILLFIFAAFITPLRCHFSFHYYAIDITLPLMPPFSLISSFSPYFHAIFTPH